MNSDKINELNALLMKAIGDEDMDKVCKLLDEGADINVDNGFCLEIACLNKDILLVNFLIDSGINVKAADNFTLGYIGSYESLVIFKKLLGHGALLKKYHNDFISYSLDMDLIDMVKEVVINHNVSTAHIINYEGIVSISIVELKDWAKEYQNRLDFNNKLKKELIVSDSKINNKVKI